MSINGILAARGLRVKQCDIFRHQGRCDARGARIANFPRRRNSLLRKRKCHSGLTHAKRLPVGEGSVDWARVRDELTKIDFTGWATAEVAGGDRQRLEDVANRMNQVLDL